MLANPIKVDGRRMFEKDNISFLKCDLLRVVQMSIVRHPASRFFLVFFLSNHPNKYIMIGLNYICKALFFLYNCHPSEFTNIDFVHLFLCFVSVLNNIDNLNNVQQHNFNDAEALDYIAINSNRIEEKNKNSNEG